MKAHNRHLYGLIAGLLIVGFGVFLYRFLVLDVPLTDTETVPSWTIEANLHFVPDKKSAVKASFIIPYRPPYLAILDEYFIAQNYGITTNLSGYNRQVTWSLRRSNGRPQSLYYRAIVREADNHSPHLPDPPMVKLKHLEESEQMAVDAILERARQSSVDIQTFAQVTLKELNRKTSNAKLLVKNFSDIDVINAAITVLNHAKIFAMPVKGINLTQQSRINFRAYLAVFNGKEWFYLNPHTGSSGLPKNFLVWQYGDEAMFDVVGGKKPGFSLTISPTPINALSIAKSRGLKSDSQLLRFSLLQLPVHVQDTYKILLMLPIGAFIILLLRNFIGLKTFGTFMPVLIALAFRETHVIWGIVLFSAIVSMGLAVRFYLEKLQLLLVPRLASILTIVVLLMILISVFSQNLNLESGLSVALFPMVILTMTIERMCVTWDERGAYEAIKSGAGSLAAAVVAFWVMNYKSLQYLIFAFPELLLVLLSLILFFGQYRGYRLFELLRFKAMTEMKS
ncbi:MAG: inactive transglutaminase family protein [Legionellaceae bacterium]|nr:inactive transglutaminase family protein [Legionellaceae bacterium]